MTIGRVRRAMGASGGRDARQDGEPTMLRWLAVQSNKAPARQS